MHTYIQIQLNRKMGAKMILQYCRESELSCGVAAGVGRGALLES